MYGMEVPFSRLNIGALVIFWHYVRKYGGFTDGSMVL